MLVCFLCGSNENISNEGFRQLHGLQSKSSDSMKCLLNNLIVDSGITASDTDVVCLHCEVLCRELDAMEHERLVMRKIMRRLIHCTYRVNNLDRAWCQLDHKALGQFKLNGTCYKCKKCDFKTKRFAHITPHHTFHSIQDRKATRTDKIQAKPELHDIKRLHVPPKKQTVSLQTGTNPNQEGIAQRNEIFEFNIDSHEGDCLYSMEEVSVKCLEKEKNEEFEYDLYYPRECEYAKTDFFLGGSQEKSIETALTAAQTSSEMSGNDAPKCPDLLIEKESLPIKKATAKCCRLEYLYALHCICTHCEQLSENRSCEKNPKEKREPFGTVCDQHFPEGSSFQVHGRGCRNKLALRHQPQSVEKILKSKGQPHCSKWLDNSTCSVGGNKEDDDCSETNDDFFDLETVNIEDIDMQGEIFDEKFELFLQKTMMRLNTIDIEFVPV